MEQTAQARVIDCIWRRGRTHISRRLVGILENLGPFPLKLAGEKLSPNLKLSLEKVPGARGGVSDALEFMRGGTDWWDMLAAFISFLQACFYVLIAPK